ncbi:MAG: hypothetical protein MUO40_08655, partial [Anaerolineaceae bacterium]|nr:hypothetical protein [Anaerolineaceae bacterium]
MVDNSNSNTMQSKLNPLDVFIKNQVEYLREVWYSCEPEKFKFAVTFSEAEKLANEEIVKNILTWVKEQLQHAKLNADEREALIRSASGKLGIALREIIHLTEPQVNIVLTLGKERLAIDFFEQARAFDPNISINEIIQATRNLWIANSQQMLLGIPPELTTTLFAYSMLYPISDNFLDDPLVSKMEKI